MSLNIKKTGFLVIAFLVVYLSYFFYQVNTKHPYKLIYASVYSDWDFMQSDLLPLPFRSRLIHYHFKNTDLEKYDSLNSFELLPYTVLSFKDELKYDKNIHKKRSEELVDIFLSRGLDIDKESGNGCTSLQLAEIYKDRLSASFLLSRSATPLDEINNSCNIQP